MVRVELDHGCEYARCGRCKTRVVDVERGCVKCAGLSCGVKKMVVVHYMFWDASQPSKSVRVTGFVETSGLSYTAGTKWLVKLDTKTNGEVGLIDVRSVSKQ